MSMHGGWLTLRSFTRDSSVADTKLAPGTVRRIAGYASPYRLSIVAFLVLTVIDALLVVASPLILQRLIDDGVSAGDRQLVVFLALLVAGIAVVDAALSLFLRWYSSRIGEGLIYDLRSQVFGHVLTMPVAFFTRTQTGALISRLNNDVIGAQQAFTTTLSSVVSNGISVVVVTIAMFALSWPITLASLALLPVFLVPARYVGRRLASLTRESMQLNADMSNTMTERFNVAGALLVKLFGNPDTEEENFRGSAAQVADVGARIAMASRVFFTALVLVAALATALVYGVGGVLAINGTLTVGTLVALAALLGRLYGPLTAMANVRVDIMTALVSFERVFEVLDLQPMVREAAGARPLPGGPLSVEFDDVRFGDPGAKEVSLASLESVAKEDTTVSAGDVLNGISFHAAEGTITALVGPSGAGKTTTTGLLTRLYDVTGGSIRIGGTDVRDATLDSLRDAVGVVTQDSHMFHDTIRANLLYARPDATEQQLRDACEAAQILGLVDQLPGGLDTVVGDRGHRLSGGEKQRIALARLLLKEPRVVVLDEATAHLDSESEAAVQRALDNALEGRTSVVIAHRLSTIRRANQILVIDAGRVVERGTHEELLARAGVYSELDRTQFSEGADPQSGEVADTVTSGA